MRLCHVTHVPLITVHSQTNHRGKPRRWSKCLMMPFSSYIQQPCWNEHEFRHTHTHTHTRTHTPPNLVPPNIRFHGASNRTLCDFKFLSLANAWRKPILLARRIVNCIDPHRGWSLLDERRLYKGLVLVAAAGGVCCTCTRRCQMKAFMNACMMFTHADNRSMLMNRGLLYIL